MMDGSAPTAVDADLKKVLNLFLKVENSEFPSALRHRNTVIKFTKIHPHDEDSKGLTADQLVHVLNPRLRRIITLEDNNVKSPRSLKSSVAQVKTNFAGPHRKIATIAEDDENDLYPKFSAKDNRRPSSVRSNRAVQSDVKDNKVYSSRTTAAFSTSSRYSRDSTLRSINAKPKNVSNQSRSNATSRFPSPSKSCREDTKSVGTKDRISRTSSKTYSSSGAINISNKQKDTENKINYVRNKLQEDLHNNEKSRKPISQHPRPKSGTRSNRPSAPLVDKLPQKPRRDVIHVPLETKVKEPKRVDSNVRPAKKHSDSGTLTEQTATKDKEVTTDPPPETVNRVTEMDGYQEIICQYEMKDIQIKDKLYDSLNVPDVSLVKEKSDAKENLCSQSMPNLQIPSFKISPYKKCEEQGKSLSYIIGQATLTYTTKQKINFHVVEKNVANFESNPVSYPLSVVSVFRKEMKNGDTTVVAKKYSQDSNCPSLGKLVKPSEIIRTMSINPVMVHDYLNEQFVRELNFIDSFFESLQYLESCSLERSFDLTSRERCISGLDVDGSILAKLNEGEVSGDPHTMATKSLCLLNLLIHDEQRRAKNLLFVLKMREDALKDFTKSQILWLENKKRHNTDVQTLKKKQRGALLKLQHECGEMQRMRKTLLALSEKRKAALMKTKKNIELKLKSNVDVESILFAKKKPRRTSVSERSTAPLKCFDLSSSGCDEVTSSKKIETSPSLSIEKDLETEESKCQSNDTLNRSLQIVNNCVECKPVSCESFTDTITSQTAAEDFVVVDGGYLNILFQNLSLPHIFSTGKQYEVNEAALKNVVNSANSQKIYETDLPSFVEQLKSKDACSTPSTARSLVDELDQYYQVMNKDDKEDSLYADDDDSIKVYEVKGETIIGGACKGVLLGSSESVLDSGEDSEMENDRLEAATGPLPVPAGASDSSPESANTTLIPQTSLVQDSDSALVNTCLNDPHSLQLPPMSVQSSRSHTSVVDCEAERLRRQQLAIEREIKALEQQQCMLLVREIPDKPPPPYTPPTFSKVAKRFVLDPELESRVSEIVLKGEAPSGENDALEAFAADFCTQVRESWQEASDKPWEVEHLQPRSSNLDPNELAESALMRLREVLTPVPPSTASGLGTRRPDHIDDVLISEWRFQEREWTSLHSQDHAVKEQLARAILDATIDESLKQYMALNS